MLDLKVVRDARLVLISLLVVYGFPLLHASSVLPSKSAGAATATQTPSGFQIRDNAIGAMVSFAGDKFLGVSVLDITAGNRFSVVSPFALLLKDGTIYDPSDLRLVTAPVMRQIAPKSEASRAAERVPGQEIDASFESSDHAMLIAWSLILRDGTSYLRQVVTISAQGRNLQISRVQLIDLSIRGAHVVGSVEGSPIVAGNLFLGFEQPQSHSKVTGNRATAWLDRDLPLRGGQSITCSSVFGLVREGQLRRDFLAYIELERAHPYRTFLHYNSWYDLGYFTPYGQTAALDRINAFGRELSQKRGVKLDSYLFDDGWDNHRSLWKFNDGFPSGFTPLKEAAAKYDAHPGVWMSPWGGYSTPKQERMEYAKQAGYEVVAGGYALSGPKYYAAFRDVCMEMVRQYGVNQFKFDGTGNVDAVFPGSAFDSDFSAAIHLIGELRAAKPDLFINLTTGTWPSPFWLMYADSIWRGGDDDATAGVGPYRERWITYRDAATYQNVVQNGPLYPLNSLMLHGMIYAQHHKDLDKDPGNDFRNEIRSYFGSGTQLQEMYITPALLTDSNWDDLAEAAKWSRANAEVLKDTHWVGGDPAWLEVYGWAAWTPAKGILVLRNPSDKPQAIRIKLQEAFELPPDAPQGYSAKSPWSSDEGLAPLSLTAREFHEFQLAPFQVLTLDVNPQ